jgi:hypothetical protein
MATPTGYQRVTTATDYDVSAYQIHLRFDGVDDFLVTNSIDFTATDKVMVAAGVRKLSDAATACLAELSAIYSSNNGAFLFAAPAVNGLPRYDWYSRGTLTADTHTASSHAAPVTSILSAQGNISGDSAILRVNGTQAASSTTDQGTGNYGNYPLYIGRRAGTSVPFNGHLYSLIIRGAASTDSQIASVERYINGKTKAYTT